MAACRNSGVAVTQPLDPETELHIKLLEGMNMPGFAKAAAHMRKLAGENAELRADIAHCESGKDRDRQLRDDARAERDAALREFAAARNECGLSASDITLGEYFESIRDELSAERSGRRALETELAETKAELSAARATLAAERTLRASFGGHLRALAEAYDMAPGGAFEPAKVVRAAVETKAELERLREAVRYFIESERCGVNEEEWQAYDDGGDVVDREPFGDDAAAALLRLHERNKP